MDDPAVLILLLKAGVAFAFLLGMLLGKWFEARIWRSKGDHEYMNRMASGGHLYHVKRETQP